MPASVLEMRKESKNKKRQREESQTPQTQIPTFDWAPPDYVEMYICWGEGGGGGC